MANRRLENPPCAKGHGPKMRQVLTADGKPNGWKCRECERTARRDRYAADPEAGRAQATAWRKENPERHRANVRAAHARARDEAIAAYGGTCACCGESEPRFLTLDHIDGPLPGEPGAPSRSGNPLKGAGTVLYVWLRKQGWPAGIRVLCWNCNCGRERNAGVCPHVTA